MNYDFTQNRRFNHAMIYQPTWPIDESWFGEIIILTDGTTDKIYSVTKPGIGWSNYHRLIRSFSERYFTVYGKSDNGGPDIKGIRRSGRCWDPAKQEYV